MFKHTPNKNTYINIIKYRCSIFSISKDNLKRLLKKLSKFRGTNTELVSILVPTGYNISEIGSLVTNEMGTAVNIKSKTTRKNVISALKRIDQKLKEYRLTPKNGLCIYSGNISEKIGEQNVQIWCFEPSELLNKKIYRCDKTFILEPLRDMVEEKEIYGLLTIDKSEAAVGWINGKSVKVEKKFKSMVPGKTGKGGQSAQRFERVRKELLKTFLKQVGDYATKAFETNKNLIGIIIGGPGLTKNTFVNNEYLSHAMTKKIIGTKDIGYAGEEAIHELYEASEDILKDSRAGREKAIIDEFFNRLKKDEELVVYGYEQTIDALKTGAIDRLLISEEFPLEKVHIKCKKCSYEEQKITKPDTVS
ncbi:MAG: peptide chain release factor aRF-1, partial [Candidatus Aenigmarchaeota archaeon]|nr:peptide chain release factor aRF-1 [Candidatus Aenigmarchaeota archaeon]